MNNKFLTVNKTVLTEKNLCFISLLEEKIRRRPSTTKRENHWGCFILYLAHIYLADIFHPKHGHLQCKLIWNFNINSTILKSLLFFFSLFSLVWLVSFKKNIASCIFTDDSWRRNIYSLLFKPFSIKLNLLIISFSLTFLTNTLLELILSTGVNTKSEMLCPTPWKCEPTGKLVSWWHACRIVFLCPQNLSSALCPVSPQYCGLAGQVLSPLEQVPM